MTAPSLPATASGRTRWLRPLQSVRVRITFAAVLVTAVAVGTAGWALVDSIEDAQTQDVRDQTDLILDDVADRLKDGEDPEQIFEAGQDMPPIGGLKVTDAHGQVVASTPDEFVVPAPGQVAVPDGQVVSEVEGNQVVQDDDEDVEDGGEGAIELKPETVTRTVETADGELTITAELPVDQVARNVEQLTQRLTIGLPLLVALVGVIAWVLVGRALRPVEAIRAEVERITGTTMHRRVPEPPTSDEIGRLARTMNTMLGRLEDSAGKQRRFVADASHELRSPVAVIRAGLELARNKNDHTNWMTLLDSLLAEESRLETLLDDLLLLAANDDNGTTTPPTRSVDLTTLTATEARRPRRVPVELVGLSTDDPDMHPEAAGAVTVVAGDADQLARALGNLVDNAARHATSVVQISLVRNGDAAHLAVDDDGPGIPLHDRERVFERFTRLDDGRARHEGGTGLGLAVVQSIISSHNGSVHIVDSPLGGAGVVIELPTRRHRSPEEPRLAVDDIALADRGRGDP